MTDSSGLSHFDRACIKRAVEVELAELAELAGLAVVDAERELDELRAHPFNLYRSRARLERERDKGCKCLCLIDNATEELAAGEQPSLEELRELIHARQRLELALARES